MAGTDPTRTAAEAEIFAAPEPTPGLLLAWAPPGATPTDRARIGAELVVGRSLSAGWVVDDDRMSGLHFRVRLFGEALLIEDAGSRNGTFVDGERIEQPRAATSGTVVRAGRSVFVTHDDLRALESATPATAEIIGPFFAAPLLRQLDIATRVGRHLLLVGPSGTGKELCARWLAGRIAPGRPFVAHNCARSTSAEEAESTLFGVARGVFSGVEPRAGLLEEADGGVLLLDEVHTLPRRVQQSLLRFTEDGLHARIGMTGQKALAVRLVLATNLPLADVSGDGADALAPDLVARVHVVCIAPLAERRADTPTLFLHALRRAAKDASFAPEPLEAALGAEVFEALCLADWSERNVRGLQLLAAEVVAAVVSAADPAAEARRVLAERLGATDARRQPADAASSSSPYERHRERIVAAWQSSGGNLTKTEQVLREEGVPVNRRWLAEFLRRWGVRP